MDCIFCKIINNEIPSSTVYENEYVKVIMNIHPVANGHLLVIPKHHYNDLVDITDEDLINVNKMVKETITLLMRKLNVKGLTVSVNYGDKQEIKHYHAHIVPNDKSKLKDIEEIFELLKK